LSYPLRYTIAQCQVILFNTVKIQDRGIFELTSRSIHPFGHAAQKMERGLRRFFHKLDKISTRQFKGVGGLSRFSCRCALTIN